MARSLKSGKIAVKLAPDTLGIIRQAVQIRLELDELPDYLQFLLEEAKAKLEGEKCTLRKSEFFALFHNDTMQYIDIPTQMIIREAVQLETAAIRPFGAAAPLPVRVAFVPISENENIPL